MNNKDFLLSALKTCFKTINPWKKNVYTAPSTDLHSEVYINGWNDCIREIKKNEKKYIQFVETLKT